MQYNISVYRARNTGWATSSIWQTNAAHWSARRVLLPVPPRSCQEPAYTMFLTLKSSHCHSSPCSLALTAASSLQMQKKGAVCSRTRAWSRRVGCPGHGDICSKHFTILGWSGKFNKDGMVLQATCCHGKLSVPLEGKTSSKLEFLAYTTRS